VANSQGAFATHNFTLADFQTVVMAEEASGWAHASAWRASELQVESLAREAIAKAERGASPRQIPAGEYAVVFDPYVTQDLLAMLNYHGMGAGTVLEGRSWMIDRQGKSVMSPLVTIWDDGCDPSGMPLPFDVEGSPKRRVDIIKQGVIIGPVYDRYTAGKTGAENTGHAVSQQMRAWGYGQLALNLFMEPGSVTTEEMIRNTQRGLYVTRFWYTRLVHPRDCVVTGMTRDGVFMIEAGELAYPVKNLRFTQSYVEALAGIETLGQESRQVHEEFSNTTLCVPALKIEKFNFTGTTV
jgi:PmbA protein